MAAMPSLVASGVTGVPNVRPTLGVEVRSRKMPRLTFHLLTPTAALVFA